MELKVLVVKDEEGELRPQAGCWRDNENGQYSAKIYQAKHPEITIVSATLQTN